MKKFAPLALSLALASLAGCSSFGEPAPVRRAGPSYESAAQSAFLDSGRAAVGKLVDGLPADTLAGGPVLVATVVNVNNLTRSAPLGRTLSEQYASHMAAQGFNVKEVKLRGELFVREGTGELLLSRELRDIARSQNAAVVLVGTYSPASDYTYVSIKLVRTEDSRILRGHDYALPNDRDVQRLLQDPTFR